MERFYVSPKKYNNHRFRVASVFPEQYQYGICNLGSQMIYREINKHSEFYCDRFYFDSNVSTEMQWSLRSFDVLFVSLSFETNVINFAKMCNVNGIPLYANERTGLGYPLIIAGGLLTTYNPEPFAEFIDAAIIGEGEECIHNVIAIIQERLHFPKANILESLQSIRGVYVPSFFEPILLGGQAISANACAAVRQTKPVDINKFPLSTAISSSSSSYNMHSFSIEMRRGCTQNCRFCVMSSCTKPARLLSHAVFEELVQIAIDKETMFVKLFYEGLNPDELKSYLQLGLDKGIRIRVGSQRVETTDFEVIDYIAAFQQRKITFAPETSSRLRNDIGKDSIYNGTLFANIEYALKQGISDIGLYFIVGLPTETDDDLVEIAGIINDTFRMLQKYGSGGNLVVGINPFFAKPNTPLQWSRYIGDDEAVRKLRVIVSNIAERSALQVNRNYADETIMLSRVNYVNVATNKILVETTIGNALSFYQTIISRGDRRVSRLIDYVKNDFDSVDLWKKGLDELSLPIELFYDMSDSALPWDIVSHNVKKSYLQDEHTNAKLGASVVKCAKLCTECDIRCLKGGKI